MSYDLYFTPRSGALAPEAVSAWARGRAHYRVEEAQVWYENPDTGVYFVLEFPGPGDEPAEDGGEMYALSLNINFFRPSFFALEAAGEIAQLVRDFDLRVFDPQIEDGGADGFSEAQFVASWNHGNAFAVKSILSDPKVRPEVVSLPTAALERSWAWNFRREALQAELGPDVFVPKIMYLVVGGEPVTAMVWPDALPIAAIEVDWLVVPRKELAPRRFLLKRDDRALLRWRDALPVLKAHGRQDGDGVVVLDYVVAPKAMQDFVRGLPANGASLAGVAPDKLLDRELVEAAADPAAG